MGSSFGSLTIGLSALYAQRKGLDVTGHNLANVSTDGYSRQRVSTVADAGPITPASHARGDGIGEGVRTADVDRLRDAFLEVRAHREHSALARLDEGGQAVGRIETIFGEPSEDALGNVLAEFWDGWDELANRPDDPAAKRLVVERGRTLAATITGIDERLAALGDASAAQVTTVAAQVNGLAAQVAALNGGIAAATNAGLSPYDLMDERDRLVTELAAATGGTARAQPDGVVDVVVGGTALVRGDRAVALTATASPRGGLTWPDGRTADVGGRLAGLRDVAGTIVPGWRQELAAVRDQLVAEVAAAYSPAGGPPGTPDPFFAVVAGRLTVDPDLVADPSGVVAGAVGAGPLDGSRAAAVGRSTATDTRYRELIVSLGVDGQGRNRQTDLQRVITTQVDAARESVAGVDLDEEMTNMIAFQQAYNAAARFITAIDEALDTLINGTGRVGR